MSRPCANAWKGCEGEVTDHARRAECVNCRATEGRWRKRKQAELLQRHRNLTLWDHRIEMLLPDDANERLGISNRPPPVTRTTIAAAAKVTAFPASRGAQQQRKRA